MCERWREFSLFLADMGEPKAGQSLDRIDNSGNYEPGNCRWATAQQQSRNRRTCRMFTLDGETKCLADWCDHYGVGYGMVLARLGMGWPLHRALTQPRRPGAAPKIKKRKRKPISEMCRERGLPASVIYGRVESGWSLRRALDTPCSKASTPCVVLGVSYKSIKSAAKALGVPSRTLHYWVRDGNADERVRARHG